LALFKSQISSYGHIDIQPAAKGDAHDTETEHVGNFIRKDSIQTEIENSLLGNISPPATPLGGPRTFAEAAMSTRRDRRYKTNNDGSDPTLAKPMSLESLGPFKYTFKKKKKTSKWTSLDLGAADSASEGGSTSEIGSLSKPPSPSLQTSYSSHASTFTLDPHPYSASPPSNLQDIQGVNSAVSASTPDKTARTVLDIPHTTPGGDPTPIQTRFHLSAQAQEVLGYSTLDQSYTITQFDYSHPSDTLSIEGRTNDAMANLTQSFNTIRAAERLSDDFDSLEWDPVLPEAPVPPHSPESATNNPQPVAYTTVGSIINPNATPQFTAPNRIQRDGSGRRPLLPLVQGRHHDSIFQQRSHPPLGMQSSMQYTQQLAQSPNRYNLSHTPPPNSTNSSRSARSVQHMPLLTEQENNILAQVQGTAVPRMLSGNHMDSSATRTPSNKLLLTVTDTTQSSSCSVIDLEEEDLGQFTNFHGPVQGLEKMQTLQRLAKFDNPMQSLALSRLSEFSVAKSKGLAATLDNPAVAVEELLRLKQQSLAGTSSKAETASQKPGELNRTFQFPPSSFVGSSTTQTNPLFGAFSPSTMTSSEDPVLRRPGHPAPIMAGPPGQRQLQGAVYEPPISHSDSFWASDPRSSVFNPFGAAHGQPSSLWSDTVNMETFQPLIPQSIVPPHDGGGCNSSLVDTVSIPGASKYYLRGFPSDMTGRVVPLTHLTQKEMEQISNDLECQTAEEKAAKKAEELDNWFYGGQRRFAAMSAVDHIREHEERQRESGNPLGPIGQSYRKSFRPIQNKPLSVEDSNKMTTVDAAAPLLSAAFGSLLYYASNINAPDTGKVLSGFEPSPAWHIDTSANGSSSFYGEDWGPPPRRISRDPRNQSTYASRQSAQRE
jgi:hypothetical protein